MLARQALDGWHILLIQFSGMRVVFCNIEDGNLLTLPRIVEAHMDLESTVSAWRQIEKKSRSIACFRTLESLQTLSVLSQSTKAEVLKTNDSTVGNASKIHRVVPDVVIILHPLVAVRAARHKTSVASRVILIRWQAEDLEAL